MVPDLPDALFPVGVMTAFFLPSLSPCRAFGGIFSNIFNKPAAIPGTLAGSGSAMAIPGRHATAELLMRYAVDANCLTIPTIRRMRQ